MVIVSVACRRLLPLGSLPCCLLLPLDLKLVLVGFLVDGKFFVGEPYRHATFGGHLDGPPFEILTPVERHPPFVLLRGQT